MAKSRGWHPYAADSSGRNDLLPDLKFEQVQIKNINAALRSVRKLSNRQVSKVKASIRQNGFVVPVLVGKDDKLVDGHIRVEAAHELGIKSVPCIRVAHLDERALRALTIVLNKTQETGEWDEGALKLELAYQLEFGTDLTVLGFEPPEIDSILEISPAPADEIDPVDNVVGFPEADAPAVTQLGDIWSLGDHMIYCGNVRDIEVSRLLFSQSVADLVFTDPPYNVRVNGHVRPSSSRFKEFDEASGELSQAKFTEFLKSYLTTALKVTRPGVLFYSFMDWRHLREMLAAIDAVEFELINICVWVKTNGGMGSFYRSRHELVFVMRHPGALHMNNVDLGANGRNRTNVWEYAGATGGRADELDDFSLHPTVKPVRLVEDAILDATVAGATVFDPFLGSGTTLLAAERARRRCVGVEIAPAYVDVAIRRWESLTGCNAIHEATGQTFAERSEVVPDAGGVEPLPGKTIASPEEGF